MTVRIKTKSRLQFIPLVVVDGFTFWDLEELPTIPNRPDDRRYQVKSTDRIDLLAYRFYGDPVLWPFIAAANGMEEVPTELTVGQKLRIPSPSYVQNQLFKRRG